MTNAESADSESALLVKLRAGSLDALGLIYDLYQRMVYRTALGITGDSEAAADLLQDVFLRLYRFAQRIDPERPLGPWLYRMTVNLSRTWVKNHNRWVRPLEDIADWITGGWKNGSMRQSEAFDTWRQVQQALQALPLSQRTVVVLYYLNDLPVHEISTILDIPAGTVKSRLHYGRQALRQHLGLLPEENLSERLYEFT